MRIVIHLEPGSHPLRGWVSQDGKEPRQRFEGWLDLTRLLTVATGDMLNPSALYSTDEVDRGSET